MQNPFVQNNPMWERMLQLAVQVLEYSRNTLFVDLRFLENALSRFTFEPYFGTISPGAGLHRLPDGQNAIGNLTPEDLTKPSIATNGERLFYDPAYVLREFKEDDRSMIHAYLHMVMHCIFRHFFADASLDRSLWDLSCDIAAEAMVHELMPGLMQNSRFASQESYLKNLASTLSPMTADKIYNEFQKRKLSEQDLANLSSLFAEDDHFPWYQAVAGAGQGSGSGDGSDSPEGKGAAAGNATQPGSGMPQFYEGHSAEHAAELEEMWKDLSQRIQTDMETFGKQQGYGSGSMVQNLQQVNRERYDYGEFLRKFAVRGEVMQIDEDEFDYNFYTYGLRLYGNVPLIEPLEYKEVKRVRDFVIAIDTSGSVQGELVQKFLQKTYNILKQEGGFFRKFNLHIIQCDTAVQKDVKITSQEELDAYLKHMKLYGFGGTDFRPVFAHVDELIRNHEFTNLKGLIYFTDGYGTFPKRKPDYETAFVFIQDAYNNPEVPPWAIRLVLEEADILKD